MLWSTTIPPKVEDAVLGALNGTLGGRMVMCGEQDGDVVLQGEK